MSTSDSSSLPFTSLFINGQWVPSSTSSTFPIHNPSSPSSPVGHSASASVADCTSALTSAATAFRTWEHTSLSSKRSIFLKAAELLASERYKKKVIEVTQSEIGAVEPWILGTWAPSVEKLKWTAGCVNELRGETFPSDFAEGAHVVVQRRAMGVVFTIAPWNAPLILTIRAVAIPLICGNTVVLKPSEFTPRTQAIVVELFQEAGLPNGVLNYLPMSREDAPELTKQIIANPAVRKINFTGSDRVGKILAAEAAKYLKPCVFELGGKAPCVVLADADIPSASRAIAFASMINSGQVCMSTERVIVLRSVAQNLIDGVKGFAEKFKVGDPRSDNKVHLGALFHEPSAKNVIQMITEAKEAGAQIVLGDLKRNGAFVNPHLVVGGRAGMRIWERESFGPVTVFAVVDTIDEAVELANATEYSLSASLWTKDVNLAFDVGGRIRAGCTSINGPTFHNEPILGDVGLGGASGYGRFDVDNFTDKRMIVIHPPNRSYPLVG
ncbi:hypothetical protein JAAARDRAFT_689366 [Jaapia argillacea MUCL 33604]|uniref:Aldehyde dehydrogenase domain-containing protein n=1 Tax=Jaapia argillacea MUCL 33604 TaxID=933084 RepID=A0A067PP89_9AGAM|nr:hypothetical protein JAAARDRAFT_689366 [Jaapia argillacea MUCL 33604]